MSWVAPLAIMAGTGLLGSLLGSQKTDKDRAMERLMSQLQGLQPPDYSQYNLNLPQLEQRYGDYFGQGLSNLTGSMNRAGSGAGIHAYGQAQSMGLTNPYSLQERARTSTMSQFAPQFGELEQGRLNLMAQLPQMVSQFNRQGAQMGWSDLMQKYGLMSGAASGQRDTNFGRLFASGLPGIAQVLASFGKD